METHSLEALRVSAFSLLPKNIQTAIQRRMHYTHERAAEWFANVGPDHVAGMLADWYGGYGKGSDVLAVRSELYTANHEAYRQNQAIQAKRGN